MLGPLRITPFPTKNVKLSKRFLAKKMKINLQSLRDIFFIGNGITPGLTKILATLEFV